MADPSRAQGGRVLAQLRHNLGQLGRLRLLTPEQRLHRLAHEALKADPALGSNGLQPIAQLGWYPKGQEHGLLAHVHKIASAPLRSKGQTAQIRQLVALRSGAGS
jgi:hypothetical protein